MGYDAYANENGTFIITIIDYKTGEDIGYVRVDDLEPNNKIQIEIIEGYER